MQLRNILPKTLFGRMFSIILIPMIFVQAITVFIFYDRHWDTVTRHMAENLTAEFSVLVDTIGPSPDNDTAKAVREMGWRYFSFPIQFTADAEWPGRNTSGPKTYAEEMLRRELDKRIAYDWRTDVTSDPNLIYVDVKLENGTMRIYASRKRIFSSTSWTFIGWTVGSSVLMFGVALLFMRGQVRPIRRLANAARQLGLGRPAPDYRLEGAKEVRLAGRAFQAMRHRIMRQMNERTDMLAGVSHDLRTPLTRIRLQLALMAEGDDVEAIRTDLTEMEDMIDAYLAFAAGAGEEAPSEIDVVKLLTRMVAQADKTDDVSISLTPPLDAIPPVQLRSQTIQRAFQNVISNAGAYASKAIVSIRYRNDEISVFFDDDGAGIPPERRADAIRPFIRLEQSRNRKTGGTGLGLSITSDIVLSHGGELTLADSPLGGLRVVIKLPV